VALRESLVTNSLRGKKKEFARLPAQKAGQDPRLDEITRALPLWANGVDFAALCTFKGATQSATLLEQHLYLSLHPAHLLSASFPMDSLPIDNTSAEIT